MAVITGERPLIKAAAGGAESLGCNPEKSPIVTFSRGGYVPKYLLTVSYTTEGAKGLLKDGGSRRRQAAEVALKSVGGTMESFYFAFGEYDVYAIVDAPDNVSVAAASIAIGAAGGARVKTVALLSPSEIDEATKKKTLYTPPGN
jgi:uncharacterized protein with GYD domain